MIKDINENINIKSFEELVKPNILKIILSSNDFINNLVINTRNEIINILNKSSNKKICIVGPCSIHNIEQAKKYAGLLKKISDKVKDKILVVMRVYFEKPRTTVGWKGLINDPDLNNTFNVNKGLKLARELLLYINSIGLPCCSSNFISGCAPRGTTAAMNKANRPAVEEKPFGIMVVRRCRWIFGLGLVWPSAIRALQWKLRQTKLHQNGGSTRTYRIGECSD